MKKLLLVALCLLSFAAVAQAQRVDGCGCGVPAQMPSSWTIRHTNAQAQQLAMNAFNTWNNYVDLFRPTLQTGDFDLGNGVSEIYFIDLSTIPGLDSSTLGYTPSLPDGAFGNFNECPVPPGTLCGSGMQEADVMMNSTVEWAVNRPTLGTIDYWYEATATHELGHGLGFHHNWANFSEMNYLPHFARYLSRADVLAARQQFPSRVKSVTDLGTYPFTYDPARQTGSGDGGDAVTIANVTPASVAAGGKITLNNWTAENLSNGSVSTVRLRVYLSTDQSITTNDILLGAFHFGSSDALTTWSQDTSGTQFTIPANTPAGQYYVGAIIGVGDNNFQADSISFNNSWVIPTPISVGSSSGGNPTTCTISSTNVCLLSNRFKVSVTFNGQTMLANQFTDKTGLFSQAGDSQNIEVLLKMIDACGYNQRFWVYSGGTTDQTIVITVLDTRTGATKTYNNPNGTAFKTITDGSAFTCQ